MPELAVEVAAHPDITIYLMGGMIALICVLFGVVIRLIWPMLRQRVSPMDCGQYRQMIETRLSDGETEFSRLRRGLALVIRAVVEYCVEVNGNCAELKKDANKIIDELLSHPAEAQRK